MKRLVFTFAALVAVVFAVCLFYRFAHRAIRREPAGGHVTEVVGDESSPLRGTSRRDADEPQGGYEAPSVELLRLRAEVARLREEIARLKDSLQTGTNELVKWQEIIRRMGERIVRLEEENSLLSAQNGVTNRLLPHVRPGGAWLGIAVRDANDYENGIAQEGARVFSVIASGPAEGAVKPGDVITAIDGRPVPDVNSFTTMLAPLRAGATVELTVLRGGVSQSISVTSRAWSQ